MENIKKYYCKSCNKTYKTYKTFWYHNKTQHKIINDNDIDDIPPKSSEITPISSILPPKSSDLLQNNINDDNNLYDNLELKCEYCNKNFSRIDNLKRHENDRCKKKELIIKENEKLQLALSEIAELKKLLLVKMNKECKAHPRTIEKINRALANKYKNNNNAISSNNTISNSNNNNNNGVINNYNIIALGKEKLEDVLSKKQQVNILKKDYNCLQELVKLVHFNDKYPQFKNILITSVVNNIGYIFDEKEKQFISTTKDELLEKLIMHRMSDIVGFHETHFDELSETQQNTIQRFIDKMEDSNTFSEKRKKAIKLIIYNNRDKVTNEIVSNLEIYI